MSIVVIFPTERERNNFSYAGITVLTCGIGSTACALTCLETINSLSPTTIILAGVAGRYNHSDLSIGDCVLVKEEREPDLGIFFSDGFKSMAELRDSFDFASTIPKLISPFIDNKQPFMSVISNTVNSATSPYISSEGVDIENMEGAGFFRACRDRDMSYYEIRAISNSVDTKRSDWNMELAINNLSDGIKKLINYLKNNEKI